MLREGSTVYGISRTPGPLDGKPNYTHLPHDFLGDGELPEVPSNANGIAYCPGSIVLKPFERLTRQDIVEAITLNATSAFWFARRYLTNIRGANDASVLLFSTVAVQSGLPYHTGVAMAKGAVEGLTRALAAELAPGIRVNAIAPSLTDTPLAAGLLNSDAKAASAAARHPLAAIGTASEVALLGYHVMTQYRWLTGQVLGINGGLGTLIR
ncbi:SDR family oxidoreductase [Flavobacterium sp. MFBS3-15]|uniref:SDR family NAD(P)-dependent oxidoreductase n=1 Tax=Flavobacterium sp. MFBS3-15 TaxID=2989816 RepID=UPI0022367E0D|nr:SDR family oxidoreductase [Flavobacterium sp. MFBS3-15]MCW4469649.1 SDR family oxidoreductase [Flavobacterium sp. MFBS3-15]